MLLRWVVTFPFKDQINYFVILSKGLFSSHRGRHKESLIEKVKFRIIQRTKISYFVGHYGALSETEFIGLMLIF